MVLKRLKASADHCADLGAVGSEEIEIGLLNVSGEVVVVATGAAGSGSGGGVAAVAVAGRCSKNVLGV